MFTEFRSMSGVAQAHVIADIESGRTTPWAEFEMRHPKDYKKVKSQNRDLWNCVSYELMLYANDVNSSNRRSVLWDAHNASGYGVRTVVYRIEELYQMVYLASDFKVLSPYAKSVVDPDPCSPAYRRIMRGKKPKYSQGRSASPSTGFVSLSILTNVSICDDLKEDVMISYPISEHAKDYGDMEMRQSIHLNNIKKHEVREASSQTRKLIRVNHGDGWESLVINGFLADPRCASKKGGDADPEAYEEMRAAALALTDYD
jgi:hypothetical protein